MTETEKVLCEILNQYCFDWVWNEPLSEFRENIKPALLNKKSQSGCFVYKEELIPVPEDTDGPFFMYGLFYSDVAMHLRIPSEIWIDLETLCNEYNVLIDMYGYRGKMLHKKFVFIHLNKQRTRILIAIKKDMSKKIIPFEDMDEVYFTVYYDSDIINDCHVTSHFIPLTDTSMTYRANLQTQLNALKLTTEKVIMYLNGMECTTFEPVLVPGDYFDIIVDDNIQMVFDIDLSKTVNDFGYYSLMDKTYKQIVHIPKALNPDNKVVTHNTCDIWVRRKWPTKQSVEGVYLHRAARRGVTQITHNDFGVPFYILDAFRDHLDTQDITLHVVCRVHEKDNVLVRDASFIDLLYTHSDIDIYNILKGAKATGLPFWKADTLEQTTYVKMFFDLAQLYSVNLDYYVEALGYYHTVCLLASRVVTKIVSLADTPEFYNQGIMSYIKPPLYQQYLTLPIVYQNGIKLKNEYVQFVDMGETIDINLTSGVILNAGDKVTTVIYLDGNKTIYKVDPTLTNKFIEVPYTKFRIYQEVTDNYRTFKGVDQVSTKSHIDVTDVYGLYALTTLDNGLQISYGPEMMDKTYVIFNECCSYTWKVDISPTVLSGENIVIPIELYAIKDDGTNIKTPILNFKNISVYLNGRYLIKDLDFIVNEIVDHNGYISFKQVVVQTMEYLIEPGTNYIEILLNTDEVDDSSMGFQIDNICTDNTPANLWFPSVSLLHVGGKLETEVEDKGIYLTLPTNKYRQGAPYEVQTSVPGVIHEFITKYHTNQDKKRITDINSYFGQLNPIPPSMVLLTQSHRIYSTLINRVLRDIIFENKKFADDPDINKVMAQLVDYEYLRNLDIVQKNKVNTTYVDFYPAYRQYSISDENLLAIRTIIEANMPTETIRAKADTHR